jgi:hypothetical protein
VIERRRGRPRRVEAECASVRVWAWVTPAERRAIERCALESHMDVGVLVREAINDYVATFSEVKLISVTGKSRPSVS